jgi:NADP-dependent 3-hydroxy acid dehydrogenase YdfG
MRPLAGAVAVVTGAGSGIGRAVAQALVAQGAVVWAVGRRRNALEETAASATGPGQVHPLSGDVSADAGVADIVDRLLRESGGVDVLVHCAGAVSLGPVESAPVDELDRQYRVNVRAPFLLTQALLPSIRARRGQIVFVNSSAGLAAPANAAQYAATKFALRGFADSLRAEVNGEGVRVLTVYPGRTATVHEMEGKPYRPDRLAQPEDVAATIVQALAMSDTAEITDLTIRPMHKG